MLEPPISENLIEQSMVRKGYLVQKDAGSSEELAELAWVHDLLVDACAVIDGSAERRRLKSKWEAKRQDWIDEGLVSDEEMIQVLTRKSEGNRKQG